MVVFIIANLVATGSKSGDRCSDWEIERSLCSRLRI